MDQLPPSRKGGARPGSGRKSKTDEERVIKMAKAAIKAIYGSEQAGFEALLKSREPVLIKFVFEHAMGKPKERVEVSTEAPPEATRIGYGEEIDHADLDLDADIIDITPLQVSDPNTNNEQ